MQLSTTYIYSLPDELLVQVQSYLSLATIFLVKRCSKKLDNAIVTLGVLWYIRMIHWVLVEQTKQMGFSPNKKVSLFYGWQKNTRETHEHLATDGHYFNCLIIT